MITAPTKQMAPWDGEPPARWDDVQWPEWVPPETRQEIASFWRNEWGRGPRSYAEQHRYNYAEAPAFGEVVSLPELGGDTWYEGRYVHAWNNIGRLVRPGGEVVCVSTARMPAFHHELKLWPAYGDDVRTGAKTFELRRDDRDPRFAVGHVLWLREWGGAAMAYTGRSWFRRVTYVARGNAIPDGYCAMSIARVR